MNLLRLGLAPLTVVFLLACIASGQAGGQEAQVEYQFVNIQSDGRGNASGDVLVQRNNGSVEMVPFTLSGNVVDSAPSYSLPATRGAVASGTATYVGDGGGGGVFDPNAAPVIVGIGVGGCMATTAMVRRFCTTDCRDNGGVAEWNSGFCGHRSTCKCKEEPEPPPPEPCENGAGIPSCDAYWPRAWQGGSPLGFNQFSFVFQDHLLLIRGLVDGY